jgi:hypothetical protein
MLFEKNKNCLQRFKIGQLKVYNNYFGLTDERCKDLELLLNQGKLSKNSNVVIVEKNKKTYCEIKNKIKFLFPKHELYFGKMEEFDFTNYKFDLVNLDFYGGISNQILKQIENIKFFENADLHVNFSLLHFRNPREFKINLECKFIKNLEKYVHIPFPARYFAAACDLSLSNYKYDFQYNSYLDSTKMYFFSFLNLTNSSSSNINIKR